MADRFYNISADEMTAFLTARGFQSMQLPNTYELVFGKIVRFGKHRLSLRVYTGINPSGESRAKGMDAIRIVLYCKYNDVPKPCGVSQKCLRVKTWEKNMATAIARCEDVSNFRYCSDCGSPMVQRCRKDDKKQKFWGCVAWAETKCHGRPLEEGSKP